MSPRLTVHVREHAPRNSRVMQLGDELWLMFPAAVPVPV